MKTKVDEEKEIVLIHLQLAFNAPANEIDMFYQEISELQGKGILSYIHDRKPMVTMSIEMDNYIYLDSIVTKYQGLGLIIDKTVILGFEIL